MCSIKTARQDCGVSNKTERQGCDVRLLLMKGSWESWEGKSCAALQETKRFGCVAYRVGDSVVVTDDKGFSGHSIDYVIMRKIDRRMSL